MTPTFRAGDSVHHAPSNEDWLLATDQIGDNVSPCGWPECYGLASDCTLIQAATDEERLKMLHDWAALPDTQDHRVRNARATLADPALTAIQDLSACHTNAHPETQHLLNLAAEAQRTGHMPDLTRLNTPQTSS